MTVPHLQDSTENELPEGNHTENERIKLVTPCGNPVVAIEAPVSAENHDALTSNILMAAKQHLEKLEESEVIVLIIGTSQSERIVVEIASKIPAYFKDQVNIFIADSSIERLMAAQKVCTDVIHWPADEDEPSLVEKTKSTCKGGADLILDFVGTPRTIKRAIKLLNKGGSLVIGTDTITKSSTSLHTLIAQESTNGIPENKNINETIASDHFKLHCIMSYDSFEV
ncbi:hypothetical protein CHS0354_022517 [Potamilus streckersoni]|uniref:Alcohol dehydrogenase-like C-terminal domain-containing protein n=1 Tax=Potamilus streckersoni TaxID=2493646 RepID=A0AAE0VRH6_9BIVA|nr:hypothetical protein CHS0354_022517 [Potamilus streckersoni]